MAHVGRVSVLVQIGADYMEHVGQIDGTITVLELKHFLALATGVPPDQQCLSQQGNELNDNGTISLENKRRDCVLEMVPAMSVVVIHVSGEILLNAHTRPWGDFFILKRHIQSTFGHALDLQRFVLGDKILRDDVDLGDVCRIFEVRPGDQLRVQLVLLEAPRRRRHRLPAT